MLPDFPVIKKRIGKILNLYLESLIRQEPLLSQVKHMRHFEGNKMINKPMGGEVDETEYQEVTASTSIKREDVIAKGHLAFVENMRSVAEEMQSQQAKYAFGKISEITEKVGNVVNAKGQPFTHELFIESLSKIHIDFDDQGNPILPSLFVNPTLGAELKDKLPEWEANLDYKKQFNNLIENKRKEWHDRESRRKLVD